MAWASPIERARVAGAGPPMRDRRPARPDVVARLRPQVAEARLVLVLDPTGLPTPAMTRIRRALRPLGDDTIVIHVRNATFAAVVADTPLGEALGPVRGPTTLVASRSASFDAATALYDVLVRPSTWTFSNPRDRVPRIRNMWLDGVRIDREAFRELIRPPMSPPGASEVPASALPSPSAAPKAHLASADAVRALRDALAPHLDIGASLAGDASGGPVVVHLQGAGARWIDVVKAIRSHTGRGLAEVRAQVESAPVDIEVSSGETADALVAALEAVGAAVRPRPSAASGSGWIPVDVDADAVFAATPSLTLAPGWALHGRAYVSSSGGNGVVCAVRDGAPAPGVDAGFPLAPHLPNGAHRVEPLIRGDGALNGYLEASILRRELREFAAWWHGVHWSTYAVVDAVPDRAWTWLRFEDETRGSITVSPTWDLRPRVERGAHDDVFVTFFSVCELGSVRLACHRDRYRLGSYEPIEVVEFAVATAGGGYVV